MPSDSLRGTDWQKIIVDYVTAGNCIESKINDVISPPFGKCHQNCVSLERLTSFEKGKFKPHMGYKTMSPTKEAFTNGFTCAFFCSQVLRPTVDSQDSIATTANSDQR